MINCGRDKAYIIFVLSSDKSIKYFSTCSQVSFPKILCGR